MAARGLAAILENRQSAITPDLAGLSPRVHDIMQEIPILPTVLFKVTALVNVQNATISLHVSLLFDLEHSNLV
jgi:hypothetical protein